MQLFFKALAYYTRIPTPAIKHFHPDDATKAIRYFSLVGIVVGLICGAVSLSGLLMSRGLGILLAVAAGILATGAFHEDGLADMADGFGGGYTREKIMAIMKDSRIGSYGVIALIMLLATKVYAIYMLFNFSRWNLVLLFATYHALARMTSGSLIFCSTYARTDGSAKIATNDHAWGKKEVAGLIGFGLLPLGVMCGCCGWYYGLVLLPLGGLLWWFRHYCHKHIGGYTGDCLGALEQLAEVVALITFNLIAYNLYEIYI